METKKNLIYAFRIYMTNANLTTGTTVAVVIERGTSSGPQKASFYDRRRSISNTNSHWMKALWIDDYCNTFSLSNCSISANEKGIKTTSVPESSLVSVHILCSTNSPRIVLKAFSWDKTKFSVHAV